MKGLKVEGVTPDARVVTNANGGQQSDTAYAFHLVDWDAFLAVAKRLKYGVERGYERDNWKKIPAEEHFNHMLIHAIAAMAEDPTDDHLGAMMCRAMMFYSTLKQEQERRNYEKSLEKLGI